MAVWQERMFAIYNYCIMGVKMAEVLGKV